MVSAVLGIILLTRSLVFLGQVLSIVGFVSGGGDASAVWNLAGGAAALALTFAAGVFLLVRRDWVAERLVPEDDTNAVAADELLRLALIIIGVWLTVSALPELLGSFGDWAARSYFTARNQLDDPTLSLDTTGRAIDTLVALIKLVFGLFLLWRAKVLSKRLWFGESAVEVDAEEPSAEAPADLCPNCGAPYNPADYTDLATARCERCHQPLAG